MRPLTGTQQKGQPAVCDATIKYSRWINGLFTVVWNKHIPSNWSFGKGVILENLSVLRIKASFCFRYSNQSFSAASTAADLCNWLAWLTFWNWKQNFDLYWNESIYLNRFLCIDLNIFFKVIRRFWKWSNGSMDQWTNGLMDIWYSLVSLVKLIALILLKRLRVTR